LETPDNKPLTIDATKFRTEGNALVADIPNAVLTLPEGQSFQVENPAQGVTAVNVTQPEPTSVRVRVTGNQAPPTTEVVLKTGGLAYSLNPEGDEPDEEIVVTGEGEQGYRVPNASTATRTDTPIRDIPASIQVVPRQVIEDRGITDVAEALENVSGIDPGPVRAQTRIRGFTAGASFFVNGSRRGRFNFENITTDN
ncbi:AMIN domain-containing protein, partial [Myxacorys almedinensis]